MTSDEKKQLQALWKFYGTAELIHRIGTILFDLEGQIPDKDWKQECRESADLLFKVAFACYQPVQTNQTDLYKVTRGLNTVPPLRERR